MSESTQLLKNPYEEEEDELEFNLSHRSKVLLYAFGSLSVLITGWFFCFYLPALFIPPSIQLHGIVKLAKLNVSLGVLDDERVTELMGKAEEARAINDNTGYEPTGYEPSGLPSVERIIMIGDVHGHYDEFKQLLHKVKYNSATDHLLVLGDFISKGPDSFKMLDYLIENEVDCVLGNHEYYILQNYAQFHGLASPYFVNGVVADDKDSAHSIKPNLIGDGFNSDPEFLLAKKLQPHHVKYINKCAIIKELGPMPLLKGSLTTFKRSGSSYKTSPGVAVHAGLRWDLALNEQNPQENFEIRLYLKPFYNETTNDPLTPNSVSWSKIFNKKQKESETPVIVYYGHDARRGLDLKRFTKGLDSGCDKGDSLTAMVFWNEKTKRGVLHREAIFDVDC